MYEGQCLVCAWLCSCFAICPSMGCATSHRQLGSPARCALCACACTRGRNRRTPTSYGRREISPHDCLQQVEKYDSDFSCVCSEEEVRDEDGDGARLASTHCARAAADVPRTGVLSTLMLHLCPPFSLLRVCLSQMAHCSSLDSGLAQCSASTRGSQWCI